MSRAAEKERQHREDVAKADRLGQDLGFGEVTTVARSTVRLGQAQAVTGAVLVIGALSTALPFGLARVPWTPKLIVLAASVCAAVAGWQLVRLGLRPRAENLVFWYPGGLIKLVHDEPEPRVLRWEDLDSAEIAFDTLSEERHTGLDACTLRGTTGTEISLRAPRWIVRQLAAEADRVLSARLVPPLIRVYESGEPVIIGAVRIDRDGVEVRHPRQPPSQALWTDLSGIVVQYDTRSGSEVPAESVRFDRAKRRPSLGVVVSGVPNGILIPHLIEYVAARHGIPVRRSGPGTATSITAPSQRLPLAPPEDA